MDVVLRTLKHLPNGSTDSWKKLYAKLRQNAEPKLKRSTLLFHGWHMAAADAANDERQTDFRWKVHCESAQPGYLVHIKVEEWVHFQTQVHVWLRLAGLDFGNFMSISVPILMGFFFCVAAPHSGSALWCSCDVETRKGRAEESIEPVVGCKNNCTLPKRGEIVARGPTPKYITTPLLSFCGSHCFVH